MVMKAEKTIKPVLVTCITKAEDEDVGDSKRRKRVLFHLDQRELAQATTAGQRMLTA